MEESLNEIEAAIEEQLDKIYQIKLNIMKDNHKIEQLLEGRAWLTLDERKNSQGSRYYSFIVFIIQTRTNPWSKKRRYLLVATSASRAATKKSKRIKF